jgi:hypothetical protein
MEHRPRLANLLISCVVLAAVVVAVIAVATMDPAGKRGPGTGRRYIETARGTGVIPESLLGWEEVLPAHRVELEDPVGMAVDGKDRIYVAGERLLVMGADGKVLGRSEEFEDPLSDVAVSADGRIYVVSSRRVTALESVEAPGKVVRTWDIGEQPTVLLGITATPRGVFVTDAGGCRVLRLLDAPKAQGDTAPAYEVFASGFFVPSCFAIGRNPEGEVVTVDPGRHKVQVRNSYGDVVRSFGQMGEKLTDFHGCCNPTSIAFLPDQRVVTAEKGLVATRVKVYEKDGELESVVAGPQSFDHRPDGPVIELKVALDSKGRVLVLDPSRRQVRIFQRKGKARSGK